jgi:hypothetical protein
MSFHSRHRLGLAAALALGCCAFTAPSPALAATQIGDTPADFPQHVTAPAHIGDTPADFPQHVTAPAHIGDTPADFPGAASSRTPHAILAQPERTVGGNVDPALPIALSLAALLLGLFGVVALRRTETVRRHLAGRAH